jgi:acyl-lipid omega-6 desaturase (Delta-12 desaturase)
MEPRPPLSTNYRAVVQHYIRASTARSLWQVGSTFAAYFGLWLVAVHLSTISTWLALLVAPLLAGYLLRIFSILHDCGHGAYFTNTRWCDVVGMICAVFVLTPYDDWRSSRAVHHAGSGNLDRRRWATSGPSRARSTRTRHGRGGGSTACSAIRHFCSWHRRS